MLETLVVAPEDQCPAAADLGDERHPAREHLHLPQATERRLTQRPP
jgi:hypothetical protein